MTAPKIFPAKILILSSALILLTNPFLVFAKDNKTKVPAKKVEAVAAKNDKIEPATNESTCAPYIQGINHYDELEEGRVVVKYSIFELMDWSPHSAFEEILATEKTPKNSDVHITYLGTKNEQKKVSGKVAENFAKDPKFKKINIDFKSLLHREVPQGKFTIEVITPEKKSLCKQSLLVVDDGD